MSLKVVLFDLDGTLLPMNMDTFIHAYFSSLAEKLSAYGYEKKSLIGAIYQGIAAMVGNDGEKTNEEAFWQAFACVYGEDARRDEVHFREYYEKNFDSVKAVTSPTEKSAETVKEIKKLGLRTALATNPVFPAVATEHRIAWAGLSPADFEFYTTYENSSFCKPNPKYYESLLPRLGVAAEECLMVGNDAIEDTAAEKIGMKVFLLTDCLLGGDKRDISSDPQGSFDDLLAYIRTLL